MSRLVPCRSSAQICSIPSSRLLGAFSSGSDIVVFAVVNLFRHTAACLPLTLSPVASWQTSFLALPPCNQSVSPFHPFSRLTHFLFLSDDEDDVSDSAKSGWWSEAGGRYRVTFLPAVQTRPRVYGSLLALHRSWSSLIKALASHLDNSDLQCRLCRV